MWNISNMNVIYLACVFVIVFARDAIADDGDLVLQPEFDNINLMQLLKNDKLLKLQLKCVLFNGPCDAIGHWVKPRVKAALLGECLQCTPVQKGYLQTLLEVLMDYFPDIYRAAVAKFVHDQDITISQQDQKLINKINSDEGWAEYASTLRQVVKDMKDGKITTTRP